MGNIVTYIQEQQSTFSELSFTAVDSLICSAICYFNFGNANPAVSHDGERIRLHDVVALTPWPILTSGSWLEDSKETTDFCAALMASRRYRDAEVAYFAHEFSDVVEKQFSATTLFLGDGVTYLAFRGTDGSFAGWKEDFNLCFRDVIPSQRSAEAYLSGVASATEGPLLIGGHSKGGNLAEYSALVCEPGVFDRIAAVYNHDGPSFLDDPSPRIADAAFDRKFNKTVPESSAFGMILERRDSYRVVQSTALSVFQHNPFSWRVEGSDFLYQDALNESAVFFDATLDSWLRSKTPEERERFVDTIYDLFVSTEAGSWQEFQNALFANARKFAGTGGKLDPETRRFIIKTLKSLGGILKDETLKRFKPSPPEWMPWRLERYRPDDEAAEAAERRIAGIKQHRTRP